MASRRLQRSWHVQYHVVQCTNEIAVEVVIVQELAPHGRLVKRHIATDHGNKQEHAFSATSGGSTTWLIDSGASSHMCPVKEEFDEIRPFVKPVPISIANGCEVQALGSGSVPITLKNGTLVRIFNVLFVPDLDRRLISILALVAKGLKVEFLSDICGISHETTEITRVRRNGKLFILDCKPREKHFATPAVSQEPNGAELWHARLGHYPMSKIKALSKCVNGVEVSEIPSDIDVKVSEGVGVGRLELGQEMANCKVID